MKKIILIFVIVLFVSLFLCADVYVKTMEQVESFNLIGKANPETIQIKEQWIGKNKFAQISKEFRLVVDNDEGKILFIIHKPKVYYELPTDLNREYLKKFLPEKILKIISGVKLSEVKVTITNQRKKIANWDCYGVDFEMVVMIPEINIMPRLQMRIWMTEDLSFDLKGQSDAMSKLFGKVFTELLDIEENALKEFEKTENIKGFQVGADLDITIFGSKIRVESQVLEVSEKPAPAGVYSVPKGYTKKNIKLANSEKLSIQ